MKKLGSLADVMVGQIMTRVSSKDGEGNEVKVIVPGAVCQGYINEYSLGSANLVKKLGDKFYTKPGDLVMKLTADYDVALVKEEEAGIAISSLVCVIRSKDIEPKYLCAVLNSEKIKNELQIKAAGAIRPMIKVSDVRDLDIPVVSKEKQEKIGRTFELSGEKIQTLQEIISNERAIMNALVNNHILEEMDNE